MPNNSHSSFIYVTNTEPHKQRRKELLSKYPQIKNLFGYEPRTKYITLVLFFLQLGIAYLATGMSLFWWLITLYFIGATGSHIIFAAIHEITHNLAFKAAWANRCLAVLINLPLGIPVAISFEKYHHAHHRFMGDTNKDVDIPLPSEAKAFHSTLGKLFWLLIQPLTYSLRPLIKWPQKPSLWELVNLIAQLVFNWVVVSFWGWGFLVFLVLATLIGMSLHPMATHFIGEHYVVHEQQETYSYYGLLNYLTFNFGHHVEHHDFPVIPWSRIAQLRKIAPEYYNSLYAHRSWLGFMVAFIFSKKLNLFSRIIRS